MEEEKREKTVRISYGAEQENTEKEGEGGTLLQESQELFSFLETEHASAGFLSYLSSPTPPNAAIISF